MLRPGAIDLYSDPTRRMPVNDAFDREHFAGLGDCTGNTASTALVAFRIGHPEREPGRSPRRPLEETTR